MIEFDVDVLDVEVVLVVVEYIFYDNVYNYHKKK